MEKYRVRESGKVVTKKELEVLTNSSLPKTLTAETLEYLGVDPVLQAPKPEVTDLQVTSIQGVIQDVKGNWIDNWVISDRFSDTVDENGNPLSKQQQESNYLNVKFEKEKESKLKQLSDDFSEKTIRPVVDTGLGFSVHAGRDDIDDFEKGKLVGANTFIIASDNTRHTVTPEEFDQVIVLMVSNGLSLKQRKWAKRDEIRDATIETIKNIDPTDW